MSDIIIKIFGCDGTGTVRRRKFNTSSVTLAQVQEIANLQSNAELTWKDEEGDTILVETQSDLQEAIACAATQKSSLRLFVDNASSTPTASSGPTHEQQTPAQHPTHEQQTPAQTPTHEQQTPAQRPVDVELLLKNGRDRLLATINRARSALDTSATLQAVKEDACSIRAVFEARVERNLGTVPILPTMSFVIHAVLLWALVSPTFWLLFEIVIGAILMPRNALSNKTSRHVRFLLPLLGLRVVMKLFFGFTCCVLHMLPPLMFFFLLTCALRSCGRASRRSQRCGVQERRHGHQVRYRRGNGRNGPRASQEQEDIVLLCNIFPKIHIERVRQEYMRHRDVQRTVVELLK